MQPDRWQDTLEQIKKSFTVEDEGEFNDEAQGGTVTQYIEFSGPLGRLRLEFSSHPALLDTKTKYHKRIGSETEIEYVYSSTDKVYSLKIFRWNEASDDWAPFETNAFNE